MKHGLADALSTLRATDACFAIQQLSEMPFIRAVNYHDVPASFSPQFETHLRFYQRHFAPVGMEELLMLHRGEWNSSRPGILLSFDDGCQSHAEVVAPLLEKYGFQGWFFVPAAWPDNPDSASDTKTVSWEQLRSMDKRHIVGCHTLNHCRLSDKLSDEELTREIRTAKKRLEEGLGHEITTFCWVGGEDWSYSTRAARMIRDAGFTMSFMTNSAVIKPNCDLLQLQRTNIEADYPLSLVSFQLSGLVDMLYFQKRRRVNERTRIKIRVHDSELE